MIYVAIWADRHTDTDVYLFQEKQTAIDWARKNARDANRFVEDFEEHDLTSGMKADGWVYWVTYTCENDGIRVVEKDFVK